MTTVPDIDERFVTAIAERGFLLRPGSGGKVRCISVDGAPIPDDVREEIRARRDELAAALAARRVPLSFNQERIWFLHRLQEGEGVGYNVPMAVHLRGRLDAEALRRALELIVARHEVLRTRIVSGEDGPCQEVLPPAPVELPAEAISRQALDAELRREAAFRFDLEGGPLIRFRLFRVGAGEHVLVINQHHLTNDGWSLALLARELETAYGALREGRMPALAEPALQFADFAEWERARVRGGRLEQLLAYWQEALAGASDVPMPTDSARPAVQQFAGRVHRFAIDRELAARVGELARTSGSTPYAILLTAFNVLLSRWSGATDVVVGTPVARRRHPALQTLFGFVANTVPLRTDLGGAPSFRELLARVARAAVEADAHGDAPFEAIVARVLRERDASRTPLFQHAFVYQDFAQQFLRIDLPGLETEVSFVDNGSSKFDLTLTLLAGEQSLAGELEYDSALYRHETIVRLARSFEVLLHDALERPDQPVSALAVIPEE
ncbi:MAG TPA: condensation domain-containing protein, partial [Thermoanaerobaculia bacterium]|nr:condensation domain-containing protein [Thermoanaerobaculia bacterium]